MITDRQFEELEKKFDDLYRKYAKLSQNMAEILMKLGGKTISIPEETVQAKKDITRYKFKDKLLNKRQLVLECMLQYAKDHPTYSYTDIQNDFPDYIQGSLGVIRSVEDAERYRRAPDHFYFEDEYIITVKNRQYVICKDWTVKNINRFIDTMRNQGYEIEIIKRN